MLHLCSNACLYFPPLFGLPQHTFDEIVGNRKSRQRSKDTLPVLSYWVIYSFPMGLSLTESSELSARVWEGVVEAGHQHLAL